METADLSRFRWAVCQLDVLRNCRKRLKLQEALESLPETLDETYSRILCSIPREDSEDATKILQWLTYSARPLRIEEVAEIVAVNTKGEPYLNPKDRLVEPKEVLSICSSLVTTEEHQNPRSDTPEQRVRLAHFSVQEYLITERIQSSAAGKYAIREINTHESIAATCLAYLLHLDEHKSLISKPLNEFPLARYAAEYWTQHARMVGNDNMAEKAGVVETLALELFVARKEGHVTWLQIFDPSRSWGGAVWHRSSTDLASPLYYMADTGVTGLVRLLLAEGADVNAQGGLYGNALQAAARDGNEAVVRLLLAEGADVNED